MNMEIGGEWIRKKVGEEKMKENIKRGYKGRVNGFLYLTTVGDLFHLLVT